LSHSEASSGQARGVACIADLHCGHIAGLTPPGYRSRNEKWKRSQKDAWGKYEKIVEKIGDSDVLVVDGDAIDGRNQITYGTELITSSLREQRDMAVECILQFKSPKIVMARGTDFHTGWGGEDWEDFVADQLVSEGRQVICHDHPFFQIEGVDVDVKHHIGSSKQPHTRGTAILGDKVQNEQWWLDGGGQPLADVILRAHAHIHEGYWGYRGSRRWIAVRLPALQLAGTKFGGRRCSGVVQWGAFWFSVKGGEIIDEVSYKVDVLGNKVEAVKL
jgi:hypothetical protein